MSTDNPFDAPDHHEEDPARDFGDREPAGLDIGSVLERSWVLVTEQPVAIIVTLLIVFGVSLIFAVPSGIIQVFEEQQTTLEDQLPFLAARLGIQLIGGLVSLFFTLGAIRVFAEIAGGNEGRVSMVFSEGGNYLRGLAAQILLGLITMAGLLLFIVPGVILSIGLQFVFYIIVHERRGPIDALTRSWELTDGHKMELFIISLLMLVGIIALFCVTCGLGLFLAWPVLAMVQAVLYHSLLHLHSEAELLRTEG